MAARVRPDYVLWALRQDIKKYVSMPRTKGALGKKQLAIKEAMARGEKPLTASQFDSLEQQIMVAKYFLGEAAKEQRHQHHAQVIGILEQGEIGLVHLDEERHHDGDEQARHEIDEEQPVPGIVVGDPAADGRTERGRE